MSIALIWGLAWLPIGLELALYAATRPPSPSDVISRPLAIPFFVTAWAAWGAISGAVFAVVSTVTERRGSLENLSTVRTAIWGAIGAVALPLLLTAIDLLRSPLGSLGYGWRFPVLALAASATLGATCAAATLGLARRSLP